MFEKLEVIIYKFKQKHSQYELYFDLGDCMTSLPFLVIKNLFCNLFCNSNIIIFKWLYEFDKSLLQQWFIMIRGFELFI